MKKQKCGCGKHDKANFISPNGIAFYQKDLIINALLRLLNDRDAMKLESVRIATGQIEKWIKGPTELAA